jgi:hypothetical protein
MARGTILNKRTVALAFTILLALTIMSSLYVPLTKASSETASINAANSSIDQAFSNVIAAEKAGANVTQLLLELNSAGTLLAQAENSYNAGNLANITSSANNAQTIANQVNNDAIRLRNESITFAQNNLLLTLVFSLGGAFVFVVILLLVWRRFKRSYMKKLLELRPRGVENTT